MEVVFDQMHLGKAACSLHLSETHMLSFWEALNGLAVKKPIFTALPPGSVTAGPTCLTWPPGVCCEFGFFGKS